MLSRLLGFSVRLWDLEMPDLVLEETEIKGLYWTANDFVLTGKKSRIIMPSPGQLYTNMVWHGDEGDGPAEYKVYGIHVGQRDRLTFINGKNIAGRFVDCRKGSATFGKLLEFTFQGDPDRKLVIDRGIAHWFGNFAGVVTRNEPVLFWGLGNPDFDPAADTINVHKDAEPKDFPAVQVNPWPIPNLFTQTVTMMQRLRIRKGQTNYPFRFKHGGKFVKLVEDYQAGGIDTH